MAEPMTAPQASSPACAQCARCGSPQALGAARFCGTCGNPLATAVAAPVPVAASAPAASAPAASAPLMPSAQRPQPLARAELAPEQEAAAEAAESAGAADTAAKAASGGGRGGGWNAVQAAARSALRVVFSSSSPVSPTNPPHDRPQPRAGYRNHPNPQQKGTRWWQQSTKKVATGVRLSKVFPGGAFGEAHVGFPHLSNVFPGGAFGEAHVGFPHFPHRLSPPKEQAGEGHRFIVPHAKFKATMRGSGGHDNHLVAPTPPRENGDDDEADHQIDVVEFAAVEYLCYESHKVVHLTVCRRGPCRHAVSLEYKNENINVEHKFFNEVEGVVTLLPGERTAFITLSVAADDSVFNTERLFDVSLRIKSVSAPPSGAAPLDASAGGGREDAAPLPAATAQELPGSAGRGSGPRGSGPDHAVLGDLRRCRVVVLNDDSFPQNEKRVDEFLPIIKGFILHNYYTLGKWPCWWGLWWKLFPGINFVANQFISRYIIKTVLLAAKATQEKGGHAGEDRYGLTIVGIGIAYLANFYLLKFADVKFDKLKLWSQATRNLRVACLDTVTQLSSSCQEEFDVGRVMKIADGQIDAAVGTTWMACFTLFAGLAQEFLITWFIIVTAVDQAAASHTPQLLYLIVVPFAMIGLDAVLMAKSVVKAARLNKDMMEADDEWSSFFAAATFMRGVVTNYRKGFVVTKEFEAIHKAYNKKSYEAAMFTKRTKWNANAIPTIFAAAVMIFVGGAVARGEMTIGAFVVFVNTVNALGPALGGVFMDLFQIGKGFASIQKLSHLLNSDTRRKQLLRGQARLKELEEEYDARPPPGAPLPPWRAASAQEGSEVLLLHQLEYLYPGQEFSSLSPLRARVEGGQAVALTGPGSAGKRLVLRLLARHFLPTKGFLYVPPHWRYRFLDANLEFFGGDFSKLHATRYQSPAEFAKVQNASMGTLEYNLKFGAQFRHPDPAVWDVEIFELLTLLGVSADLIGSSSGEFALGEHARKHTLIGMNGEKLSLTNRALLSVARALLSSVDLLLVSNVLDVLGPRFARHVLGVLLKWTQDRCVACLRTENATTPPHLRKPKTLIFSTKIVALEKMAHNFLVIEAAGGLKSLKVKLGAHGPIGGKAAAKGDNDQGGKGHGPRPGGVASRLAKRAASRARLSPLPAGSAPLPPIAGVAGIGGLGGGGGGEAYEPVTPGGDPSTPEGGPDLGPEEVDAGDEPDIMV